jgi:hypothetical protein
MNGGILIYTSIQPDQIHDAFLNLVKAAFIPLTFWPDVQGMLKAIPALIALFTIIMAGLSWALYKEFGWKIYKQIGADRRMKNRYLLYQVRTVAMLAQSR